MRLKDLVVGLEYACPKGTLEQEVDTIIYDSRVKTKLGLFVAIEGFKVDGHKFIDTAIANGAKTIVVQKDTEIIQEGITVIKVPNTRTAMAVLANNFYDSPSNKLNLVGVTGTNGKTSITYLLGQILESLNHTIGIVGTIENRIGNTILKAERTTPESSDLQHLFSKMLEEQATYALMEVSSHALELNRVDGCKFKVGIFTNLTQDHLDFHHTMENYARAKAKLFNLCEVGIINIDSEYAHFMTEHATCEVVTYGIDKPADYHAKNIQISAAGVTYDLTCPEGNFKVSIPIPGKFTVYNTLAVIVAAVKLNIPMEYILKILRAAKGVPGRVQTFTSPKGYSVIVDYAHTPDGLENVLSTIKQFATNNIITVFGCGGDRDNTKRPIMGEVAALYSDTVIITSDNPRTEDPNAILDQVEVGVRKHRDTYLKIEDRKQAIYTALQQAQVGDVVLIAGKGHENYQILKDRIIHFDDQEIVRTFIQGEV